MIFIGEDSLLWPLILVYIFTTSNSTSPLGLLFSITIVIRPEFLDTWWKNLVLNYSPLTIIGIIIPLLTLAVYWTHGLAHLLLDVTRWQPLYKYKIQQNKHLDVAKIPGLFKTLLNVQLFVFIPVSYIFGLISVNSSFGLHTENLKFPTNLEMVLHLLGYAIVDEIFFYASHRLAHHKLFYQHVHKLHHQWTSPIALSSDYCHPLEHLLVNVLPNISYGLIFGSDPFTYLIWWILVYLGSQSNHSGYRLPTADLTCEAQPDFHDLHHEKFNVNFGSIGVLDWIFNTKL